MAAQPLRTAQLGQLLALADMLEASANIPVTNADEFRQILAYIGPTPEFNDTETADALAPFVERCSRVEVERFPTGSPIVRFEIPKWSHQTLARPATLALAGGEQYTSEQRIALAQEIINAATDSYAEQITVDQDLPYPHSSEQSKPGTHPRLITIWWE